MRKRIGFGRFLAACSVLATCLMLCLPTACISGPEQHDRPCPCSKGWVCAKQRCVQEELVCPGTCGDGVVCPGEECDDGDNSDCTITCNATCSGEASPHNIMCIEPTVFFNELSLEVREIPPSGDKDSETHLLYAHSSNPYHQDITLNFGISHDLDEDKVHITPDTGRVVIPSGEATSEAIGLILLKDAVSLSLRHIYVALLNTSAGEVGAPSLFTLYVRNAPVPKVVITKPRAGAGMVAVNTTIEVEFSQSMDPVTTATACSIEPAIAGNLTWKQGDRLLVFTPATPLADEELYVVTIGSGATSAIGVSMFEYSFAFDTFCLQDVALFTSIVSVLQ